MQCQKSKIATYEKDFYAWSLHNAQLIREKHFSEVDTDHLAEELESMGKSEKRELTHRLAVLLMHLLKWRYQPTRRSNSWKYTIEEQRFEIEELLTDSPSLKKGLKTQFEHAYQKALLMAAKETGLDVDEFPNQLPFTFSKVLGKKFFPGR